MTAEAAELGMSLEQWREARAHSSRLRVSTFLADVDRVAEYRAFRLAHPAAMYAEGPLGLCEHFADAVFEDLGARMERFILYGDDAEP